MGILVNPYVFVAAAPSTPSPTFANVSLLIHGDTRPWVDASSNQFPVANYLAQLTLASGAVASTGTGSRALLVPANTAFVFGTGAWCAAAYVYCGTGGARIFDTRSSSGATTGFTLTVQASTLAPFVFVNNVLYGVGGAGLPAANLVLTANTRTHVAATYDGTTLRLFVGGVLSWAFVVSLNITANNRLAIGNDNDLTDAISGQRLDEIFLDKGEAVYTATFTPPTRYSDTGIVLAAPPEPTYSNVKLNIHGSSLANNSTAILDASTAARTVTVNGNAKATTAQFRIGSSSIDFDGTGDFLTVPASADWAFTADYSVELQLRTTVTASIRTALATYVDSTHGFAVQTSVNAAGNVRWNDAGDAAPFEGPAATINTWAHVAFARFGTLLMEFLEGELVNFATNSTSGTNSVALYIGRLTTVLTTRDWTGQLAEIRICKGETPYKKSFIVQTVAHPDS